MLAYQQIIGEVTQSKLAIPANLSKSELAMKTNACYIIQNNY